MAGTAYFLFVTWSFLVYRINHQSSLQSQLRSGRDFHDSGTRSREQLPRQLLCQVPCSLLQGAFIANALVRKQGVLGYPCVNCCTSNSLDSFIESANMIPVVCSF